MSKAGERLIDAAKEAVLLSRQIAEAEARGYRKGVEDAVDAGDREADNATTEQDGEGREVTGIGWGEARAAILALLEQTEPGAMK